MSKPTTNRFSPEVRSRAVRMVFDHQAELPSQWAAINSIAGKIGCTGETLRSWVWQAERDQGLRGGPTTEDSAKIKALERENRELRQANEILRKASACSTRTSASTACAKSGGSSGGRGRKSPGALGRGGHRTLRRQRRRQLRQRFGREHQCLYKTEVIRRRGPWRSLEAVEFATLEWVEWFNTRRLLEPIGNIPPAEAEARYYAELETLAMAA